MRVIDFDHVVLRVGDIERSLAWYTEDLGLAPVRVDEWRRGEAPFPSVRISPTAIIDLIAGGAGDLQSGPLDHFCLVIEPCDLDELATRFTVVDGPGPRFGAQGIATSLYVTDPDGNTVELRQYDRAQPRRESTLS